MKPGTIYTSITTLILALVVSIANAELYKWTDNNGVIHIQDSPPENLSNKINVEKENIKRNSLPPTKSIKALPVPSSNNNLKKNITNKVEIYGTSWCPYCKKAKDYFKAKNISFTEYDIEKDKNALRRKKEVDPRSGIPTVVINGHVVNGYSSEAYDELLKMNK